jgi:hypothetical protein
LPFAKHYRNLDLKYFSAKASYIVNNRGEFYIYIYVSFRHLMVEAAPSLPNQIHLMRANRKTLMKINPRTPTRISPSTPMKTSPSTPMRTNPRTLTRTTGLVISIPRETRRL